MKTLSKFFAFVKQPEIETSLQNTGQFSMADTQKALTEIGISPSMGKRVVRRIVKKKTIIQGTG
jgi:hypothetical protein